MKCNCDLNTNRLLGSRNDEKVVSTTPTQEKLWYNETKWIVLLVVVAIVVCVLIVLIVMCCCRKSQKEVSCLFS